MHVKTLRHFIFKDKTLLVCCFRCLNCHRALIKWQDQRDWQVVRTTYQLFKLIGGLNKDVGVQPSHPSTI